jgi:hypothetical protein
LHGFGDQVSWEKRSDSVLFYRVREADFVCNADSKS